MEILAMISLEDCIGLCGLDEDEVAAISEHEHIPEMAAAALANYLLTQIHGGETIRTMIIDDIHKALDEGRVGHAAELFMALRHFLETAPGRTRWISCRITAMPPGSLQLVRSQLTPIMAPPGPAYGLVPRHVGHAWLRLDPSPPAPLASDNLVSLLEGALSFAIFTLLLLLPSSSAWSPPKPVGNGR
jgi:hypothetical protein